MTSKVSPELRDAMRQLAERPTQGDPLKPEVLLAYHLGELSEKESEAVRDRLIWDDRALAYLNVLRNPDEIENIDRSETEIAKDWESIRQLIASESRTDAKDRIADAKPHREARHASLPRPASAGIAWLKKPLPFQLLAAGLACVALGLWWQLDQLGQRMDQLIEPKATPAVIDLTPSRAQGSTRDPFPGLDLKLPLASDPWILLLNYAEFEPFDAYHGELFGVDGSSFELKHRFERLERATDGAFPVVIHRDWLMQGTYEIRLIGVASGVEKALASYRFNITQE